MRSLNFYYIIDEKKYFVEVTKKKGQKRIIYRFKDGKFVVSCPYFTLQFQIVNGLKKFGRDLIKKTGQFYSGIDENGVYVLGEYVPIKDGFVNVLGKSFLFIDRDNYYKQVNKIFKPILEKRLRYYETKMGVQPPYKFGLQLKISNYGSNSIKMHKICLNTELTHYSYEIIDSVIIHELAHHYVRNHGDDFYKVVYKFCPNYDELRKKLIKRNFK